MVVASWWIDTTLQAQPRVRRVLATIRQAEMHTQDAHHTPGGRSNQSVVYTVYSIFSEMIPVELNNLALIDTIPQKQSKLKWFSPRGQSFVVLAAGQMTVAAVAWFPAGSGGWRSQHHYGS